MNATVSVPLARLASPLDHLPSLHLELLSGYPLHDRDGFIEFATSMWLHTAHLVGKPTRWEVEFTLREIPPTRRLEVLALLHRRGQLA